MIIINGVNSEVLKKILPKLLKKEKIIGFYNQKNNNLYHKNLKVFKFNKINLLKICKIIKKEKKISFLNFAAKTDQKLLINKKEGEFEEILKKNINNSINILRQIIPQMIKNQYGRIIFISSSTAESGYSGTLSYSASKSALKGIVGTLSKEYGQFNITANIISLGYFNSGLWNELSKNKKEQLLDKTLIKKTGDFNSVFETINLIIKYDTINMSTIYLDGGNLNRNKI